MSKVWSYKPLFVLLNDRHLDTRLLAKRSGVSKGTIEKLEADEDVKLSTLIKICLALQCSLDDLVEIHLTEEWESPQSPHRMSHELWTVSEEEVLITALKDGLSISQIVEDLGRSEAAVRSHIVKLLMNNALE